MTTQQVNSRRGRQRNDAGAAAVEFAIVAPVLILLVIGMLEFSLFMRDTLSAGASVRAGARIASTEAGAGDAVCPSPLPEPTFVCAPASMSPKLAVTAVNVIQTSGAAMSRDYVDFVWVYKANALGWPGSSTDAATAAPLCEVTGHDCVKFVWNRAADRYQYAAGSWDSSTIDACLMAIDPGSGKSVLNPDADSVGVFMQATHPFVTGLFGLNAPIQSRAVLRFDPLETRSCNGNGIGRGGHQ
jgi:Flp pilus assembly protein TadG